MSVFNKEDIYNLFINKIIKARRDSAELIQKYYRSKEILIKIIEYKNICLFKKYQIINEIIEKRNKAAKKITESLKLYLFRIKVHKLIEKLKSCYTIIPNIENSKDLKICISIGNNREKTQKINYCTIRKEYAFDFQRTFINRLKYKFYFISNGKRTISKNYKIIGTRNGKYNIINFVDIQNLELMLEDLYDQEIEYYYSSSSSETTSNSKSTSNDNVYEIKGKNKEENLFGLRNYKEQVKINENKNIKVKSILKQRNFNRKKSFKKVVFGKIESSF